MTARSKLIAIHARDNSVNTIFINASWMWVMYFCDTDYEYNVGLNTALQNYSVTFTTGHSLLFQVSQVPWSDLGLHHGLVSALAPGCSDCCGESFSCLVRYRVFSWNEEAAGAEHGAGTRWSGWDMRPVFPEVCSFMDYLTQGFLLKHYGVFINSQYELVVN